MSNSITQSDFAFTKYISTIAKVKAPTQLNNIKFLLSDSTNSSNFTTLINEGVAFGNATISARYIIYNINNIIFLLIHIIISY
jgi:hypothetical protein